MSPIARFSLTALDCQDPIALAGFYAAMTGWQIVDDEGIEPPEWLELRSDGGATLAFQRAPGHQAPEWPSDGQPQQQSHLDFDVPDLDEGERAVLALGATKAAYQPDDGWRVYIDPAGHPFCLVLRADLQLT